MSEDAVMPDHNGELQRAAAEGDKAAVERALAAGADVNWKNGDRETALHCAALRGQYEVARYLIEQGADIDAKSRWGETPLARAAVYGEEEVARLLLSKGADVNGIGFVKGGIAFGLTALHNATKSGNKELVNLLLSAGADVRICDGERNTALHNATRQWGRHPDHSCSPADWTDIVRDLLAHGADPNVAEQEGITPLHWAALKDNLESVNLLLEAGADVDARTSKGKSTPLLYACETTERQDVVLALLRADADPEAQDALGRKPRLLAKNDEVLAALEKTTAGREVDASHKDEKKETGLDHKAGEAETPMIFFVATSAVTGALLAGPGCYALHTGHTIIGIILIGVWFLMFHSMNTMTKGEPRKGRKFVVSFFVALVSAKLIYAFLASNFSVP